MCFHPVSSAHIGLGECGAAAAAAAAGPLSKAFNTQVFSVLPFSGDRCIASASITVSVRHSAKLSRLYIGWNHKQVEHLLCSHQDQSMLVGDGKISAAHSCTLCNSLLTDPLQLTNLPLR